MIKDKITVTVNEEKKTAIRGELLSNIINGEQPCGAHGKCGKCKVVALGNLSELTDTERSALSAEEISHGVRLACLTAALGDCTVFTLQGKKGLQTVADGSMPKIEISPMFSRFGAAIDVGTTTIVGKIYGSTGEMLAQASVLNSQNKWGADVISRVEVSVSGKSKALAQSVTEAIDSVVSQLSCIAKIRTDEIDGVVITGNTVMLTLLAEGDAEPFSHAPFDVKRLFGETVLSREIGLKSLLPKTPVYFPPCISAFVGADITCAILSTEVYKTEGAILVDIGTNGEMALWKNGSLTVASTAAGPAFEGVGISHGMRGEQGAIDRVKIVNGSLKCHTVGEVEAVGICGSGLVDAAACLLRLGTLDESGYLENEEVNLSGTVSLTQKDIRMLQLAKSAIYAGLMTLTASATDAADAPVLYIAGGFGNYLNRQSAMKIGLLPKELAERSVTVGNAALSGASMLLLNPSLKSTLDRLIKNAKVLDLSVSSVFSDYYISGMSF